MIRRPEEQHDPAHVAGLCFALGAVLFLAGVLSQGCSERRPCPVGALAEPGAPAPRRVLVTPEGVTLHVPAWVSGSALDALLVEVRDVVPEADPRIPSTARGVPAGTTLVVLDPGAYYAPGSPTLLATGEWRAPSTIYVAWRASQDGPRLPALAHELRHLLTNDPDAGHGGTP